MLPISKVTFTLFIEWLLYNFYATYKLKWCDVLSTKYRVKDIKINNHDIQNVQLIESANVLLLAVLMTDFFWFCPALVQHLKFSACWMLSRRWIAFNRFPANFKALLPKYFFSIQWHKEKTFKYTLKTTVILLHFYIQIIPETEWKHGTGC